MKVDEKYMWRCLQLAEKGRGYVSPNPTVGCVIVHQDKIIGEGFHREYGKPHAEVNAINRVKDQSLLKKSTIYVSLEPCSHYGKTPPCARLIIDLHIPKVVVATCDPYKEVSGRGIKMLQEAGIDVIVGVLEKEAKSLNKEFFTSQILRRPYIYLKWAQTSDGFIDKMRNIDSDTQATPISNDFTRMLVHKMRSEIPAIMVGTNTVLKDNPSLTTRYWYGKNPVRVVLDRYGKIARNYKIFDISAETIVFTEKNVHNEIFHNNVKFMTIAFDKDMLSTIMSTLNERKIDSVLIEGGRELLQSFIDDNLWDEAFMEISDKKFGKGILAPVIKGKIVEKKIYGNSKQIHLTHEEGVF